MFYAFVSSRARLLVAAAFLAGACGNATSGGGGFATYTAGAPDTACSPDTQQEGCYQNARMGCDAALAVWKVVEVCGSSALCVDLQPVSGPHLTQCQGSAAGGDATASGDTTTAGGDTTIAEDAAVQDSAVNDATVADATVTDTAKPDVGTPDASKPDVSKPDVAPADTASSDAGPDATAPNGPTTIAELQQSSANCPSPDPKSSAEAPGVQLQDVVIVSPVRKEGATLVGVFAQQGSGPWSGIYLVGKNDGPLATAQVGDVLNITGDFKDFYCFSEIFVTAATPTGTTKPVAKTLVNLSDLGGLAGNVASEPYEGVLVEVQNVVLGTDALGSDGKPHGDLWVGKDSNQQALRIGANFTGVYLSTKNPDGTFTPKYKPGTQFGALVGVVDYAFGSYRLTLTQDPQGVVVP